MSATTIILAVLLGLGLSASAGLNTFLPLLLLAAAAHFHIAGIALGAKFQWLQSDAALVILIVASTFEVIGDKFPAVDHILDSAGTFLRPVAGALAAASVFKGVDPTVAAVAGIIIGAPTSLGFHTLKATTRVASTATTFGCANPVLSFLEDVISLMLSVIAIFAPIVVPLAIAIFALTLWTLVKRVRRRAVTSPRSAP